MKHNDIKIGVEYAVGKYNVSRMRVVDVPSGADSTGTAVSQATVDEYAARASSYGVPRVKRLDVAEGVGNVAHSRRYSAGNAKGAYAIVLDRETGEPRTHDDGTLKIEFLHSREFKTTWADFVAQSAAQAQRDLDAAKRRAEESRKTRARRNSIIERIERHRLLDATQITARDWETSKIGGMWLQDWEMLLDRVDEIAKGGAK